MARKNAVTQPVAGKIFTGCGCGHYVLYLESCVSLKFSDIRSIVA